MRHWSVELLLVIILVEVMYIAHALTPLVTK